MYYSVVSVYYPSIQTSHRNDTQYLLINEFLPILAQLLGIEWPGVNGLKSDRRDAPLSELSTRRD